MTITTRPASQAQFTYIKALIEERSPLSESAQRVVETARGNAVRGTMTAAGASGLIDFLKQQPRTTAAPKAAPGYYVVADGTAVKVQANKAGTGTYALVWSGSSWDYAPGLGSKMVGMVPMTGPDAARLGLASGRCIVCCRTLGGETLTARVAAVIGYGETCASHNGWAFPKGAATQRAFLASTEGQVA